MKRIGACLLVLFAVCLGTAMISGCGTACPIDTNGDGLLSQEEMEAFQAPTDPNELVAILFACSALIPQ